MPWDPETGEFIQGTLEVGPGMGLLGLAVQAQIDAMLVQFAAVAASTQTEMALLMAGSGAAALTTVFIGEVGFGAVLLSLGAPYYQARKIVENENSMSGFSQGFTTGVLDWEWRQAVERFSRPFLRMNHWDEGTDAIRVNAYHKGLKMGFARGKALSADAKKTWRRDLRSAAHEHMAGPWSNDADEARLQQVNYVIALASAGRRTGIIKE